MIKTMVATPDPDKSRRTIEALKKLIASGNPDGGRERNDTTQGSL